MRRRDVAMRTAGVSSARAIRFTRQLAANTLAKHPATTAKQARAVLTEYAPWWLQADGFEAERIAWDDLLRGLTADTLADLCGTGGAG